MNRAPWWLLALVAALVAMTTVLVAVRTAPPGDRGPGPEKPTTTRAGGAPWVVGDAALPWSPPPLEEGHRTVRVSDDPSTRLIELGPDEDCLLVLPSTPVTDYGPVGTKDALVTVVGGRNVVVIGGHIRIERTPVTELAEDVGPDATVLTVGSTQGFPPTGVVRVDGEGMRYSALDETHLYVEDRRYGFFNDSEVSSEGEHRSGAPVYLEERNRSALSFQGQTGIVHVEGLLIDGFVNDGLRISGGEATVQIQRTRIGPNTNFDLEHQTDGHPDDVQAYGGGAAEIRLAQVTLLTGPNGNGLLNKGSDSGDAVPTWRLRDVEVVSPEGRSRSLVANSDSATTWDVADSWLRHPRRLDNTIDDVALLSRFRSVEFAPAQPDIVEDSSVGVGYESPGYVR